MLALISDMDTILNIILIYFIQINILIDSHEKVLL